MQGVSRAVAVRQLALAAAAGEVLDALAEAGIRALLLKGAAIGARLYENPAARLAGDIDLLVAPGEAAEAVRVLGGLGFRDPLSRARGEERASHAVTFYRPGPRPATVDLHAGLYWCHDDPEAVWDEFSRGTRFIRVGDHLAEVLGDPAQAFVIAAHAVQHGGLAKPQEDLRRALALYRRDTWIEAAAMARRLDAEAVFAAGLRLLDAGQRLAAELGLNADRASAEIRLRMAGAPPVAVGVMRLAQARSARERVRLVLHELFPSRSWMRRSWPFAARGPAAMALAYLYRPLWLAEKLPRAVSAWRRANGSS